MSNRTEFGRPTSHAVAAHGSPLKAEPSPSLLPTYFLALGTFAIGTEGFMIAPLLPTIAGDLGMSLSATAMLVVVFTLTLAVSSPISTVLTGRLNRRDTLIIAMGVFTVGNLVAAHSTSFSTLMFARVLMAIASGLYVPGANALAGAIAGPSKRGTALAIVSGGMTIAIALGLPLGAVVGHAFGWRATFLAVAVMGIVAVIGLIAGIDRRNGVGMAVASLSERLSVVRQGAILRLLAVTLFWSVGAYTAYPYIAPYLISVLGFGPTGVAATVSLWGIAAAAGVTLGGVMNDRFGSKHVVTGSLALLLLSFIILSAATQLRSAAALAPVLIAVVIWGFSVWSFFPAQMARLIAASSHSQASVSLSLNTSTMYLGFSVGSALGAGIVGWGAVWGIGLVAALAEAASLIIDRFMVRPPS
jgi:MFS transporter, DHA1 family, purine base/nucleoside efflux pump